MTEWKVIADQDDDEAAWQFQRRRHLTASDVFKFLPGDVMLDFGWWMEGWMGKDHRGNYNNLNWVQKDVMNRKLAGTQPFFSDPVKVYWGQAEEDHFRNRFAEYSGVLVQATHKLIKNPRWEYLAASLDSWVVVPDAWEGLERPEMFDRPEHVIEAIEALDRSSAAHLEMKTTSDFGVAQWLKGKKREPRSTIMHGAFQPTAPSPPVYYQSQGLTQMAIGGIPQNLFVVQGGISHMTAHTRYMTPRWLEVLDRVNEEVAESIDDIRKVLDAKE